MRRRIRNMPSASMVVAFTALLLALGGTAVALPGSNTVTSGDIVRGGVGTTDIKNNSGVRTQDIRNSTIRSRDIRNSTILGRDVRNNTLTGADINESTLGTVPSASFAGGANNATNAAFAGLSASTNGLFSSGVVTQNDSGEVVIVERAGWRLTLQCDFGGTDNAGADAEITITNVSAGGGAAFDSDDNSGDLEPGDEDYITSDSDDDMQNASFSAIGSGGAISGTAGVFGDPDGAIASDCLGHVTLGNS